MPIVQFPATPTQEEFINSTAYLVFLLGPRGEGKTTAGVMRTLKHALEHSATLWPVKWAVVRDTWENLKITTLASIRDTVHKYRIAAEGLDKLEPRVVRLGSIAPNGRFTAMVEYHFFGLDQPADANRLQGFEGAGAWIEEPAPAADLASGVPEEALLAVTSLRQHEVEGMRMTVQVTFNPPDEGHWTIKYRDDQDTIDMMAAKGITIAFFEIKPGENPGVTQEYRERNRAILEAMGRWDLIARLVEGRVGFIQMGVAVTPAFNDIHCAKVALPILRRMPIYRGWDFGLHPTVVWWQKTPLGRIYIFNSIRHEYGGCEQHILEHVIPWQVAKGITDYDFIDIGDASGQNPEQKDSNTSAVAAIEEMLTSSPRRPASFIPGPMAIADRVGSINALLRRSNKQGLPIIQVDPEAVAMKRALGGGWHRKKSPAGIIGEIVKDEHSEHGDALGHSIAEEFPIPKLIERPRPRDHRPVVAASRPHRHGWMTS